MAKKTKKIKKNSKNKSNLGKAIHNVVANKLENVRHEAISQTVQAYTAAWIISLHDEFNFGHKRLRRALEKVDNQFECITAGTVSVEDLVKWCKEYGINIK